MWAICDYFFLTLQNMSGYRDVCVLNVVPYTQIAICFSMIKSLHIENYALISQLDINLHGGFSVITGETGAGKSIILGAIGLLKGQRADLKSIKAGEKRCVVEAVFDVSGYDLNDFFISNDLDFDSSECIIRRELTAAGKSRAFINDTPVNAALLKELGDKLVDIHSQHQNLLLNNENFQLDVLDIIASDGPALSSYKSSYNAWRKSLALLNRAIENSRKSHDDEDYWRFQYNQLLEASLDDDNEQEAMEQEAEMLDHAEEIRSELSIALDLLSGEGAGNGDGGNVLTSLKRALAALASISDKYREVNPLSDRLDSCYIELKDITGELEAACERVEADPQRLMQVQDRLNVIYTLQRKHNVSTISELKAIRQDYEAKLDAIDNSDEIIAKLQKETDELREKAVDIADDLARQRTEAAKQVELMMTSRLQTLGMPNVKFCIDIRHDNSELTANGADKVTFLFSANKNGVLQDVARVASGGEVARVMLSLKSLIADAVKMPTIIFDEIDTGVSGKIAEKMAEIMKGMGTDGKQVISITHLPQIAALGEHHYRVYKDEEGDTATTHIVEIEDGERVEELAHMLSGAVISEAAIANARQLLGIF